LYGTLIAYTLSMSHKGMHMRQMIVRLGRTKTTIYTTVMSVLLSVLFTAIALQVLGLIAIDLNTVTGLLIAIGAPLIVMTSIIWPMTGLILKIHTLEEEMRLLATYDSLTGLLGRRTFMEETNYVLRLAERQGLEFTILIVDLDHFKKINDRYGHIAGDRVLESFGSIMRQVSRESDLVGRLGGEEFAVFLPATTAENAYHFAQRLHEAVREAVLVWNGIPISYTISVGLAYFPKALDNIGKALSAADKALYSAKMKGRNQTAVYNAHLNGPTSSDSAVVQNKLAEAI